MKNYRFQSLIGFVLFWAMITAVCSCGGVHKGQQSSSSESSSSEATHISDAKVEKDVAVKSNDSASKKQSSEEKNESVKTVESGTIVAKFKTGDSTSKPTGPVKWSVDLAGNVSFDPGGRDLSSIEDHRSKKKAETKQEKKLDFDSTHVVNTDTKSKYDSSQHENDHTAASAAKNEDHSSWLTRISLNWLLLIPIIAVGFVIKRYWTRIKPFFVKSKS